MEETHKARIAAIMADMHCPKGFQCADKEFADLCKAVECGLKDYLDCGEASPANCAFSLAFGNGHICRCPLRVYLARELKR